MELDSQKAELLAILHENGVFLNRNDFKNVKKLKWSTDTPLFIKPVWEEVLRFVGGGLAIEELSTGYFFATLYDKKRWRVARAPSGDTPRPTCQEVAENDLTKVFRVWAKELSKELAAPRPWGERFPVGTLPTTLVQTAQLVDQLKDCGLDADSLRVRTSGAEQVLLSPPDSAHSFMFRRKWKGNFKPGQHTRTESFITPSWDDVLKAVARWITYLRREGSVVFPTTPTIDQSSRPKLLLKTLHLTNIRRFTELSLNLHPTTNLFCGQNGTGKSTILRSLAIALCHEADTAALVADVPGDLVTLGQTHGTIEVSAVDDSGTEYRNRVELTRKDERDVVLTQEKLAPETFLCGYGSVFGMVAQQSQSEYSVRDATRSLFDYGTKLFSLEVVLRRLQERLGVQEFEEIVTSLSRALSYDGVLRIKRGGGVELSENGHVIPFDGLADGYRVSFSWLVDFYGWAMIAEALVGSEVRGLLLVDEVDKHMHPSVQARLIEELETTLPEIQKFFTSHNPLTVLGASPESIFVIEERDSGVVCHQAPDFRGYSVEDIYTDDRLFDTEPYSPELQRLKEQYEELASIDRSERSENQKEQLRTLAARLRSLQML